MSQRDKDLAFFVVWVLNKAARAWGRNPAEIYRVLQEANIVDSYLIGHYDTAHTMGEQAILDDVKTLATNKGLAL